MSVEKKGKGKTGSPRLAGTFPPLPNAEFHCLCACVYAECVHECVWLLGDRETCMEIVWEKQGAVSWSTNQHQNFSTSPSNQILGPPTDRHTLPSTQSDQGKKKKKKRGFPVKSKHTGCKQEHVYSMQLCRTPQEPSVYLFLCHLCIRWPFVAT